MLDSSVVPGSYKDERPHHYFDCRHAPSKAIYRFSDNPVKEDPEGDYIQCPVTTHAMYGMRLVLNTILLKFSNNKIFGDGKGLYKDDSKVKKIQRIFQFNTRPLSVESLHPLFFKTEVNKLLRQNREFLCLVMHPKTFTEVALDNLDYICSQLHTISFEELLERDFC